LATRSTIAGEVVRVAALVACAASWRSSGGISDSEAYNDADYVPERQIMAGVVDRPGELQSTTKNAG
jgi:hypothetical protein